MLEQTQQETKPVASVLYLHGFNSSSESPKARLIRRACEQITAQYDLPLLCLTPHLSHQPRIAFETAENALKQLDSNTLLIGSSMGGFMATCLAERYQLPAVLINPAVVPSRFVRSYLGLTLVNDYTGESFTIDRSHYDELVKLQWFERSDPRRYQLLISSADEVLDSHETIKTYAGSKMLIHPKSDHSFSELAEYLPLVFAHGGIALPDNFTVEQD